MAVTEVVERSERAGALALRRAVEAVDTQLAGLCAGRVPVAVADELATVLARHERQVAALRLALVRVVTEAGYHERLGGRDPATHLATLTGTSVAKARAELELAERLAQLPVVEGAVRAGRLSSDQARVIAPAAEAAPHRAAELVAAATTESMKELRGRARATERAALGEQALHDRERRLHRRRSCRTWVPEEGGVRLEAWLTALDGARLVSALDCRTAQLGRGSTESAEQVRADALVDLVCGGRGRAELCVRVDAGALVRGEVHEGESCEVDGVGPVSVEAARSLLGEAFCTLLVTKGTDITTVTSSTRFLPRKVRMAVEARDRCCVVPGCGSTFHLQIDHWRVDFHATGPTELANLCRLCSVHHRQKTDGVLVLGGGPGKWWTRPGPTAGKVPGPSGQERHRQREREERRARARENDRDHEEGRWPVAGPVRASSCVAAMQPPVGERAQRQRAGEEDPHLGPLERPEAARRLVGEDGVVRRRERDRALVELGLDRPDGDGS